jgi:hypothetical protein
MDNLDTVISWIVVDMYHDAATHLRSFEMENRSTDMHIDFYNETMDHRFEI